jgi:CDP-diacylglycerol pyrophosphatase
MGRRRILFVTIISLATLLAAIAYAYWRAQSNPNVLWTVVQSCVAQEQEGHILGGSCVAVDDHDRVAILRSIEGREQFLLVPTNRVTGIEDHSILDPAAPNYWALAWAAAERYLPSDVTKDRTRIGLAINSQYGRSQNQLHIHISCIKPSAARILDKRQPPIGSSWSAPVIVLGGHGYRALRIQGRDLGATNPFRLLAGIPDAAQHMGAHTLVLVGAMWDRGKQPGYYLLDDVAHQGGDDVDRGHGEALLDEDCNGDETSSD